MAGNEIWRWSAVETAAAVREGRASAEEVTAAHVARMRAANPALNAVVVDLGEEALAHARALDGKRAAGGEIGSLHGVPITVKINVDVEGQANSNGVPAFAANVAPGDSAVVANLKQAGAVIVGLTNTPEFSLRGFTDNPLHGLTRNPWDPNVTCGGSSGGAGAAVAAGIGAIGHGNDIGGSLRWPASCNGIATIRPTQGRIPAYNPSAPAERPLMAQLMSTQGPLAREVADVRLGLEVMARRDPRDPWWVPAPLVGPPVARPVGVAIATIPDDMETDPEIMALLDGAAGHLSDAGYDVRRVKTPDISAAWKLWAELIVNEVATLQATQMRAVASPAFNGILDEMIAMTVPLDMAGYMRAVSERTRVIREWLVFLEECPLVLAPVSVRPTPGPHADLAGPGAVDRLFRNDLRFTAGLNVLGLPSAVVPVGLARGNPVGGQLIGSRYREDLCLDAAAAIEERVGIMTRQLWSRA